MNSTPSTERRREILKAVEQAVCKDRQNTYSDAEDNFRVIAEFWTTWGKARGWSVKFEPRDVAMMSALIKSARAAVNLDYLDNWVDLAGYATCGGGIAKGKKPEPEPEPISPVRSEFVPTHYQSDTPEHKLQVLREANGVTYVRYPDGTEVPVATMYLNRAYRPIPKT